MKYAQLRAMDVANGEGIRVSLFVSGCTHNCKGCFNKEYQNFSYGEEMNYDVSNKILSLIEKKQYRGLSLLGGEPFQNTQIVEYLIPIRNYIDSYNNSKENKSFKKKDIWIYSGYTFEEILADEDKLKLLKIADVLIDGLFVEKLLDLKLKFRGSSNQRILDVKKSLKNNTPIHYYGSKDIE